MGAGPPQRGGASLGRPHRAPAPDEIVCHNDPGPWNLLWRRGRPVALLDFDLAGPGRIEEDLEYALWFTLPFRPDIEMLGFESEPDRRRRADALLRGYRWEGTAAPIDLVLASMEKDYEAIVRLSQAGVYPWTSFADRGLPVRNRENRYWLLDRRAAWEG